jgi:DNA-binding XRE family transcriptional regulator
MEFKDKVKAVRGQLFITQGQLGKELGCTSTTINRWENGVKSPSFILEQKFKKFCKDKGINLDTLEGIE